VSLEGTSLRGLCAGALASAWRARGQVSRGNVAEMPLPAVVHWEANHWVVLYDVDETEPGSRTPRASAGGFPRRARPEVDGLRALFDFHRAFASAPWAAAGWAAMAVREALRPAARARARPGRVVSGLQMVFPVFTQVVVDRVLVEQDAACSGPWWGRWAAALGADDGGPVRAAISAELQRRAHRRGTLDFLTRKLLACP